MVGHKSEVREDADAKMFLVAPSNCPNGNKTRETDGLMSSCSNDTCKRTPQNPLDCANKLGIRRYSSSAQIPGINGWKLPARRHQHVTFLLAREQDGKSPPTPRSRSSPANRRDREQRDRELLQAPSVPLKFTSRNPTAAPNHPKNLNTVLLASVASLGHQAATCPPHSQRALGANW